METLTPKQKVLLSELKEDISLYKDELHDQVKTSKLYIYICIGVAVLVGIGLLLNPEWINRIKDVSENMDMVVGLVGESVPITFATKSFNSSKLVTKKLKGMRIFERDINRMENGIVPNSLDHILSLENELERYIVS
jgi:hypothetical protein